MLRQVLLSMSRNQQVRDVIVAAPITSEVVKRFVAGETTDDAVRVARELTGAGLTVTIDHLGEDVLDERTASETAQAYQALLNALAAAGLAQGADVSMKLSAMGQALGSDGEHISYENAKIVCDAAAAVGASVTIDMEDHTTTDATLGTVRRLREVHPNLGTVLQSYLYRTEEDVRALAYEGSRIRLCKGAYKEPETVAYQRKIDVDLSYVRCLRILLDSPAYPMFATHDPRLIKLAKSVAERAGRSQDTFEFQMLHGIRPDEQLNLAAEGYRTRVYLPYGQDWYGYFMRRLAERPANLAFFARSLVTRG